MKLLFGFQKSLKLKKIPEISGKKIPGALKFFSFYTLYLATLPYANLRPIKSNLPVEFH